MQILGRDVLISLILIGIIFFIIAKREKVNRILTYSIGVTLFSLSIVIIFSLTGISPMSGFHINIRIDEISLIPFKGIVEMLQDGITGYATINIIGNIIMFMPIGFLAPLLCTKIDNFKKIIVLGFLISLLIEFTQLFLIRGTDIDDLMLNTLGTILGYLVFIGLKKILSKLSSKIILESKIIENESILWLSIFVPYTVIIIGGFYERYILL